MAGWIGRLAPCVLAGCLGATAIPASAAVAMLLALVGNLYPVPEGPYGKLPYVYLAYLIAGLAWFFVRARSKKAALVESVELSES